MRRLTALLAAVLLLTGCAAEDGEPELTRYQASFLDLFDTVTTIVGYAESEEAFQETAEAIYDELLEYHRLFDIYADYEGMHNLKTVNDNAGVQPVEVDGRIIALLSDCRDYYELTGGAVNVAMGSVLSLWHTARTNGVHDPDQAKLPDRDALAEAQNHSDFDDVVIDMEASTVYLADPAMRLDVGAVAKGWAVEQVCGQMDAGLLVSVGGNVCATGPKPDGSDWVVGVQDPDGNGNLHTLSVAAGSVVTSGDYQRYYTVDGEIYHHLIDPVTGYPARHWRAVTVICGDSGLADALSTALFMLPQEAGQRLLSEVGAEAMWLAADGTQYYSRNYLKEVRS